MKAFLYITFLLVSFSCSSDDGKGLQNAVEGVRQQFVPDRRDDVFDIEATLTDGKTVLKGFTTVAEARTALLAIAENVVDSITVLPDASVGETAWAIVSVSVADVRTDAGYAAEMATQALLGMPVRLLQQKGWWRIRTAENYVGWTTGSSITRVDETAYREWIEAEKIIFTAVCGFSYEQPDVRTQTVSDLVFGNILRYVGESGGFYRVAYPGGGEAFVSKSESKLFSEWMSSVELTPDNIIEKAMLLKGIPYTWGGTSTKMMDCSGFTKTVFLMNGTVLLRDASQQVNTGVAVDVSDGYGRLQKGDLMFFGKKGVDGRKDRIRHVGIYLGNGEFIHEAGFVRIASLDPASANYDELNTREFVQARRIVGSVGTKGITRLSEAITN